jgi:hypothetical protein
MTAHHYAMPVVSDLSPSELVLARHEGHSPPLLETFVAICERLVSGPAFA